MSNNGIVLDACCGPKGMWFDKSDCRATFIDVRNADYGKTQDGSHIVVYPDITASFSDIPFPANHFYHVVLDPPHIKGSAGRENGAIGKRYGLLFEGWRESLRKGFEECFRVLRPGGTLIFKWCEVEVPISEVLALTPHKPLYGHRSGKASKTHWVAFIKPVEGR